MERRVKNDEVPPESRFNFYSNVIIVMIVGVVGVCLYVRGFCIADILRPEIVFPFCLILVYTFLHDMVFLWITKRFKALCYKNAFILVALLLYFYSNSKLRSLELNTILSCVFVSGIFYLIQRGIHAKCEREESLINREMFTLNGGSMLAYSFYYAYLKLILPGGRSGGVKGVEEKIDDFISHHEAESEYFRDMFPVKKLFVLIPSSSFSYDETGYGRGMEPIASLDVHTENRALTRDRVYKNTVYLVENRAANKRYYVLPETATPTKALNEICKEQKHVDKYKEEVVISFYHTLQRLLDEDPTCGTVCELIYYKDSGRSSERVNLADIIIERIEENIRREKLKTS